MQIGSEIEKVLPLVALFSELKLIMLTLKGKKTATRLQS